MKPKSKPKSIHYNTGHIYPQPSGYFLASLSVHGARYRRRHRTLADARLWIDITLAEHETPILVPLDYRDARNARQLLPEAISLTTAAREYLRHHKPQETIPLATAVEKYLADKSAAGRRDKTLISARHYCLRFAQAHPGLPVTAITTDHITAHFDRLNLHGTTRDNNRRALRTFFNWCMKRGYTAHNPALAISPYRSDPSLPKFLTLAQCKALLTALRDYPALVPYITIGLFTGIRPTELTRLTAAAINITEQHIALRPEHTKTHSARYVTIPPVLRGWLQAFPPSAGPITPQNFRRQFRRLIAQAGVDPWPPDVLRHTFATYHLAFHKDSALTSHELGHRRPDLLFTHYRGLATEKDAREFWGLTPSKVQNVKRNES